MILKNGWSQSYKYLFIFLIIWSFLSLLSCLWLSVFIFLVLILEPLFCTAYFYVLLIILWIPNALQILVLLSSWVKDSYTNRLYSNSNCISWNLSDQKFSSNIPLNPVHPHLPLILVSVTNFCLLLGQVHNRLSLSPIQWFKFLPF